MKHLRYLKYVLRHKWYVMLACFRRGLYWQGIIHDWSKFLPDEWLPYAEFFYGVKHTDEDRKKAARLGIYLPDRTLAKTAFNYAWLKHQHRNPHHWQHWILREDSGREYLMEMPKKYRLEMLCDWEGAGRAITGKTEYVQWYLKNEEKIRLHPSTKAQVVCALGLEGVAIGQTAALSVSYVTLVLLIALCIPAYAALPPVPPIPRPAPLQSPRAASVPKTTPMAKASAFTVASTGGPLMLKPVLTYDINLNQCDTNDPNCITFDLVNGPAEQRAGYDMSIQFTHAAASSEWTELGWSGAGPEDRVTEFSWFRPKWQRPGAEFFRSVSTLAPTTATTASRAIAPSVRVNTSLPGIIKITTRKK